MIGSLDQSGVDLPLDEMQCTKVGLTMAKMQLLSEGWTLGLKVNLDQSIFQPGFNKMDSAQG